MEASALDKAIKSLESSADSLEGWLAFFTFLVVAGLVLEYWHDFVELLRKRPLDKKLLQTIVGGIFITVGVAGELVIQYRASGVEARLRAANHLVEAGLLKEADEAKATAKGFEGDIATSRQAASEAGQHAAEAASKAADTNARAGALELEAAKQREKAAVAERALLELQQRLRPRSLTAEQRQAMGLVLASGPKGEVTVTCLMNNVESCGFALQIAEVLTNGGWIVPTVLDPVLTNNAFKGMKIQIHSEPAPAHAQTLYSALRAAGFGATGELDPELAENKVTLFVGEKP